jgi:hypothetical protein
MTPGDEDLRSERRKLRDEAIASEPRLAPLDISPNAIPLPLESHLRARKRHPVALTGVVENGLVRLLDPNARLPERSRVIVVAESD